MSIDSLKETLMLFGALLALLATAATADPARDAEEPIVLTVYSDYV